MSYFGAGVILKFLKIHDPFFFFVYLPKISHFCFFFSGLKICGECLFSKFIPKGNFLSPWGMVHQRDWWAPTSSLKGKFPPRESLRGCKCISLTLLMRTQKGEMQTCISLQILHDRRMSLCTHFFSCYVRIQGYRV